MMSSKVTHSLGVTVCPPPWFLLCLSPLRISEYSGLERVQSLRCHLRSRRRVPASLRCALLLRGRDNFGVPQRCLPADMPGVITALLPRGRPGRGCCTWRMWLQSGWLSSCLCVGKLSCSGELGLIFLRTKLACWRVHGSLWLQLWRSEQSSGRIVGQSVSRPCCRSTTGQAHFDAFAASWFRIPRSFASLYVRLP